MPQSAAAAVSGKVYQDINGDGAIDAQEPGIKGVTITAFDVDGNPQGTTDSLADGTYTFNATGAAPYRIEFTNIPGGHYDGAIGADSNSTIRFINSANSTDLDLALQVPVNYVPDPLAVVMAIPVSPSGGSAGLSNATTAPGLMRLPYTATGSDDGSGDINQPNPNMDISFDQVGATWGTGFQRKSGLLFSSAILKRHSGLGPLVRPATNAGEAAVPVDGVYKIQYSPTINSSLLGGFTLNGVVPASGNAGTIDLGTVTREITSTAVPASKPNALRNQLDADSYDIDALAKVGKRGFGGSEVDATDNRLWLVNLNQRSLIRIDISVPANIPDSGTISGSLVSHFDIDYSGLPVCNGVYRPWALKFDATTGYVGVTCDASTGGNDDVHAHVLSFDPVTGSNFNSVLDIDLSAANYSREATQYSISSPRVPCALGSWRNWNRWGNSWSELGLPTQGNTNTTFGAEVACPQPILADLEFDVNGDMVIGFMDRLSLQLDRVMRAGDVNDPGYYSVDAAGDTLHACSTDTGFVLEGRTGCLIDSDTKDTNDTPTDRLSLTDGPGNQGEFYFQDYSSEYDSGTAARHVENNLGTVTIVPGSGEVIVTAYDSILGDFNQGLHWYRTRTTASGIPGTRVDQYQISIEGSNLLNTKGMALGDVELMLPPAPLELGNRVWEDANGNGVQDAGEAGIDGVDVTLNCGAADFVQTTANGGQYLFTDANAGGEIPRNTSCTISVPTTHNSLILTTQTAAMDEPIGSDPDPDTGSFTFTTGEAGQNNHTYDIGYTAPIVDLELTKEVSPTSAKRGDIVTYTITLSNKGPSNATGIQVTENLPDTLSYVPDYVATQGTYDAVSGLWDVGSVAKDVSVTLTIDARLK